MKYLIAILLALLLTGCSSETPDSTAPFSHPAQSTTGPVSEPIAQPTVLHSNRALSCYDTGIADCRGLYPMGDEMLLVSGIEETLLTVLSNHEAAISTIKQLSCFADPAEGSMQVSENGIAYYDSGQNAIIYLNTDLLETQRYPLPDGLRGPLLISPDWSTVYYCSENAIHALDLQASIPRMVRGHDVASQTLTGLHLGGSILSCQVSYDDGLSECLYLSTQTGESFYPGWQLTRLRTGEDTYFAAFRDGSVNLWLTGEPGKTPWMIHVSQNAEVFPLCQSDAVVVMEAAEHGTELSYLDITSGRRTGAITLDTSTDISFISGNDGIVWFLAEEAGSDHLLLYRWSPAWSKVWSPRSYYRTYYTADAPNSDELQRLAYRAKKLGDTYGINILIGQEALQYQPGDRTFETEYRVAAYERDLAVLESALANFPEDFFEEAALGTQNRRLTISLVRRIQTANGWESIAGAQYWLRGSAYIALAMGEDLEQSFYHQLCHIIDNRVMGTSSIYDDWAGLNPAGVTYAYHDHPTAAEADEALFTGQTRAFVDLYATSFPREDRARILEYAMMPGNSEIFASETMQRKLSTLCQGIRQAFTLDSDLTFLWEQYLITKHK